MCCDACHTQRPVWMVSLVIRTALASETLIANSSCANSYREQAITQATPEPAPGLITSFQGVARR
jgi:hypothetical protein